MRKPAVNRNTQKYRKMSGQKSVTSIERIARVGGAIGSIARTVAGMAGLINSEVKFVDTTLTGSLDNTPSYALALTSIAEGDDVSQRNGRFVLSKAIHGRFNINVPTAQLAPVRCGFCLVMDKEPQLAAPSWTTIFNSTDPNSIVNKATNSDRFVILRRWSFTSNPAGAISKDFKFYLSLKGIHLKFKGTTNIDYEKNTIYLLGTSTVSANLPAVTGIARFEFYDN